MTSLTAAATADETGYRELVRQAADTFDASTTASWHAVRHVPASAMAAMGAAGVFEARWEPGAYGGIGRLAELVTELQRRDSGLALAAIGHSEIFIGALARHGTTDRQARLLREALAGRAVGCFAATEPQGGASLSAISTTAQTSPDGWHLTGIKRYVSNVGSATHAVVLARADPGPSDLSLFVVPLDAPGVRVDGFFDTSGVQSCDVGQLSLDVELPPDALLGRRGLGLLYASHLLQFERLAISALLIGAAEQALGLATSYARGRRLADGRIMDKQVIRHRLATAHAELWNLQSRLADIIAFSKREATVPAHEISALKLIAGQRVTEIIDMSMQVFGARGNTTSYPLERLWRDCRVARIGGGTDEVLADTVASFIDRPDPRAQALLDQVGQADRPLPAI